MGKPTSGGAGGSGGRVRSEGKRVYRELTTYADIDRVIADGWDKQTQQGQGSMAMAYALNLYQSTSYLNTLVRGKIDAAYPPTVLRKHIAGLDEAMIPLQADTILHRGTIVPGLAGIIAASGIDNMKGKIIEDKGYISTSFDIKIGEEFRGYGNGDVDNSIIRIRAPKGTKGFYPNPKSRMYGDQREFVFDKGTSLRILSIQRNSNNGGYYEVEAEVV